MVFTWECDGNTFDEKGMIEDSLPEGFTYRIAKNKVIKFFLFNSFFRLVNFLYHDLIFKLLKKIEPWLPLYFNLTRLCVINFFFWNLIFDHELKLGTINVTCEQLIFCSFYIFRHQSFYFVFHYPINQLKNCIFKGFCKFSIVVSICIILISIFCPIKLIPWRKLTMSWAVSPPPS